MWSGDDTLGRQSPDRGIGEMRTCHSAGAGLNARMFIRLALVLALAFVMPLKAEIPAGNNTAIVPAGRLEKDFYDWDQRHASIMALKDTLNPEIVLIGDSI